MTSPTDLAERLRELAVDIKGAIDAHVAKFGDYCRDGHSSAIFEYQLNRRDMGEEHRLLSAAANALDRLSALESSGSEVTDEECKRALSAITAANTKDSDIVWKDDHGYDWAFLGPNEWNFLKSIRFIVTAAVGPRLAKAEQRVKELEAEVVRQKESWKALRRELAERTAPEGPEVGRTLRAVPAPSSEAAHPAPSERLAARAEADGITPIAEFIAEQHDAERAALAKEVRNYRLAINVKLRSFSDADAREVAEDLIHYCETAWEDAVHCEADLDGPQGPLTILEDLNAE